MKLYEVDHQSAYIPDAVIYKSYVRAVSRGFVSFAVQSKKEPFVFQVVKKIKRVGPFKERL